MSEEVENLPIYVLQLESGRSHQANYDANLSKIYNHAKSDIIFISGLKRIGGAGRIDKCNRTDGTDRNIGLGNIARWLLLVGRAL